MAGGEIGVNIMVEKVLVEIDRPPEVVFQYLTDYDRHYTEVSSDHIERVVTVKDPDLDHPDVSFYFRQISPITGREQKIRGKVTRVEMNRYIGTRFLFPVSLFLGVVENILEPKGEGTLLVTDLHFTFLGKLARKATRQVVEHITGELVEMKEILEGQAPA